MWYVNKGKKRWCCSKNLSFILTMWYVNVATTSQNGLMSSVLY